MKHTDFLCALPPTAVPPQLLPQLLHARHFKCPHCKATQALPEGMHERQLDALQAQQQQPQEAPPASLLSSMRSGHVRHLLGLP